MSFTDWMQPSLHGIENILLDSAAKKMLFIIATNRVVAGVPDYVSFGYWTYVKFVSNPMRWGTRVSPVHPTVTIFFKCATRPRPAFIFATNVNM